MKIKKVVALSLSLLISLTLSVGAQINGDSTQGVTLGNSEGNRGVFIATEPIDQDVDNFAKKEFSSYDAELLQWLGFSNEEIVGLRLGQGFTVEPTDSLGVTVFYYPALYEDKIIAFMNISETNGKLYATFGKDPITDAFNDIHVLPQEANQIFASSQAYYTVASLSDNKVSFLDYVGSCSVDAEVENELRRLRGKTLSKAKESLKVIQIDSSSLFDVKIRQVSPRDGGKRRELTPVDNWTYKVDGVTHGTCWASCIGSLDAYHNKNHDAFDQRDHWLDEQLNTTGDYACTATQAKTLLEKAVTKHKWYKTSGKMNYKKLMWEVNDYDSPFYTTWVAVTGSGAHAMALCGYRHKDRNDPSTANLVLMDPNKKELVTTSYSGDYKIGTRPFRWTDSISGYKG